MPSCHKELIDVFVVYLKGALEHANFCNSKTWGVNLKMGWLKVLRLRRHPNNNLKHFHFLGLLKTFFTTSLYKLLVMSEISHTPSYLSLS
jgi:hypothetical protein